MIIEINFINSVSRQVSIDESMILFKEWSSLKQYKPQKPIKRGYKLWAMVNMNGYMNKFEVYQRKLRKQLMKQSQSTSD